MMKHNTLLVYIGTISQIILNYPVILQMSEYVALLTTTLHFTALSTAFELCKRFIRLL